jgi:hypothetical protein
MDFDDSHRPYTDFSKTYRLILHLCDVRVDRNDGGNSALELIFCLMFEYVAISHLYVLTFFLLNILMTLSVKRHLKVARERRGTV